MFLYKYIYVEADSEGFIRESNYRGIIDEYSQKGWRFVSAIPAKFGSYGVIKQFDLVFEKKIEE